ncbi:MAG: hypothetical protein M3389_04145, partial [Actinomycetota bacterium]|nr:hypothetical protein [Actinomycetota bacterium]
VWGLHAGIDWDWEMPAVTLVFFALAGFALSRPAPERPPDDRGGGHARDSLRPIIALAWMLLAVTPVLATVYDSRIQGAKLAFDRNDCAEARRVALEAMSTLASRPEPYEIIGWCNLQEAYPRAAVRALEEAVKRDEVAWRYRYGLAVAQAAAGIDPSAQVREARRLNPREEYVTYLAEELRGDDPARWRRAARPLRLSYVGDGLVADR